MRTATEHDHRPHDWREAGEAWGHAANDWSCLYEHYAFEVVAAIFGRIGVGPGTRLLDMACGSGLAARHADAMGAAVAGIDASAELVAIARARTPGADLRLGTMFALPWDAEAFDAVVSINGVWGGCERALDEAMRVLRAGGLIGISFWGTGRPLDLRECFKAFARNAPEQHFGSMKRLNDIGTPGAAEAMLAASGFDVVGARRAGVHDRVARSGDRMAGARQPRPGRSGPPSRRRRGNQARRPRGARRLP